MHFNLTLLSQILLVASCFAPCISLCIVLPACAADGTRIALAPANQPGSYMEQLKFAPTLAFIPTYTGKNCVSKEATRYTGLPTGDCYNLTFLMREDCAMVLKWYQSALGQCGWVIESTKRGKFSLSATHPQGLSCLLFVRPLKNSSFATELTLRFSTRPS